MARLVIERRAMAPVVVVVLVPLGAAVVGIGLAAVMLAATGYPVLAAVETLFTASFGSVRAVTETLREATPLILTGLAFALTYKLGLFNLGGEGQLLGGAMLA